MFWSEGIETFLNKKLPDFWIKNMNQFSLKIIHKDLI